MVHSVVSDLRSAGVSLHIIVCRVFIENECDASDSSEEFGQANPSLIVMIGMIILTIGHSYPVMKATK